ncbi:tRNA pseudouridine(38/39) synthase-like [Platysternon megacephalum]|uniref:Melanin-concentrating hormone receptor 1 n=1 Tax=Platysternon megacephalum TaxID=55544 RepID=A0A4D9EMQ9_9SAUR|nr:tRNA pseudouridine(38/39) synthase-like [Platysternon megacephalum]
MDLLPLELNICNSSEPGVPLTSTSEVATSPRLQSISYTSIIMPSVFGILCLFGIAGNSMVIFTVVKKSKFHWCHNVPDIFIINLSVMDLLFPLGMPFMIHQLMGNRIWHFGETMDANCQFTSTYILTAMSID